MGGGGGTVLSLKGDPQGLSQDLEAGCQKLAIIIIIIIIFYFLGGRGGGGGCRPFFLRETTIYLDYNHEHVFMS